MSFNDRFRARYKVELTCIYKAQESLQKHRHRHRLVPPYLPTDPAASFSPSFLSASLRFLLELLGRGEVGGLVVEVQWLKGGTGQGKASTGCEGVLLGVLMVRAKWLMGTGRTSCAELGGVAGCDKKEGDVYSRGAGDGQ